MNITAKQPASPAQGEPGVDGPEEAQAHQGAAAALPGGPRLERGKHLQLLFRFAGTEHMWILAAPLLADVG